MQELLERITLDLQGMKALKRYVDLLDRMDDKGRLIQGDEKLYKFCKEVRESALSIFQDYLRADKSAHIAQNGVLYLLERLNRFDEIITFCRQVLRPEGRAEKRILHFELFLAVALVNLGKPEEARQQLEYTRERWGGDSYQFIDTEITVCIAFGDFDKANELLSKMVDLKLIAPFDLKKKREWVQECSQNPQCKKYYGGEKKQLDPRVDINTGVKVTEEYLKFLMRTWDEKGLELLKDYFSALDRKMNEEGGVINSRSGSDELNEVREFCRNARLCGLKVIEDFIRDNCNSKFAFFSKIFLLERLGMYEEVLLCASQYRQNFKGRSLTMDLKEIDALAALGRFEEAFHNVHEVGCYFGRDKVKISVARLHAMAGGFDDAIKCFNELKLNGKISDRQYENFIKWIGHLKREAGKEVSTKVSLCDFIERQISSESKPEPASSTALVPVIVQSDSQELVDDIQLSDQGAGLCDEVLKEKEHVCPRSQSYTLDESDQLLLKSARRNHKEMYFATAFELLTIIKERNKGDNEAVDQLYLECDQRKGKCREINVSNS